MDNNAEILKPDKKWSQIWKIITPYYGENGWRCKFRKLFIENVVKI